MKLVKKQYKEISLHKKEIKCYKTNKNNQENYKD